jgi:hypothetical protein
MPRTSITRDWGATIVVPAGHAVDVAHDGAAADYLVETNSAIRCA